MARELVFDVIGRSKSDLEKLARDLDKVSRDVDKLDGKKATVGVDADTAAAQAQLRATDQQVDRLDGRTARVRVVIDKDRSMLDLLTQGGKGLAGGLLDATQAGLGFLAVAGKVAGVSGAIAVGGAAITGAFMAATTAAAALPAAVGLIGVPLATVMVGMDGIKTAARGLSDESARLQRHVDAAFVRGLKPAVQDLEKIFPNLDRGMVGVANSLSRGAQEGARWVASAEGMARVDAIFANTTRSVDRLVPGLGKIADGTTRLMATTSGWDALTTGVDRFGTSFRQSVIDTISDGTLDRSLTGLGDLLGEVGEGLVGFTENGIRGFSTAAPGMTGFLDDLTGFFGRFDWERLGGAVGNVFTGLGETLDGMPPGFFDDLEGSFEGLGELFRDQDFQGDLQNILGTLPEFVDGLTEFLDVGADVLDWGADLVNTLGGENLAWGAIGLAAGAAIWKSLKAASALWALKDLFGGSKVDLTDLINPIRWADLLAPLGIDLLGGLLRDLFMDPELDIDLDGLREAIATAIRDGFADALGGDLGADGVRIPILGDPAQLLADIQAALDSVEPPLLPVALDPDAFMASLDELLAGLGDDPVLIPVDADPAPFEASLGELQTLATEPILVPIDGDDTELRALLESLRGIGEQYRIVIPITGDPAELLALLASLVGIGAGYRIVIPIDGDTSLLDEKLDRRGTGGRFDGPPIEIPIDGDDGPLRELLEVWASIGNLFGLEIPIDGDDGPLQEMLELLRSLAQAPIEIPLIGDISGLLSALAGIVIPPIVVPFVADTSQATAAIDQLIAYGNSANTFAVHTQDTSGALAALAAMTAAFNAANTTARHVQTDNVPEVLGRIATLNSAHTTARHTQTDNVAQVLALIRTLNSAHTTSRHTVSDNVSEVLGRIRSLNGQNTSSTHTINVVQRGSTDARAAGGAVVGSFAGGGVIGGDGAALTPLRFDTGGLVPGYRPGHDTVPALLSPGEAVLVPELVRALGASTILRLNRAFSGRVGQTIGAIGGIRGGADRALPRAREVLAGTVGATRDQASASGPTVSDGKVDELLELLRAQRPVVVNEASSPSEAGRAAALAIHMY